MSDCRFGVSPVNYPDPDPDPKMPLTYVLYICGNILLTKGHLGYKGGEGTHLKINLNRWN